MDDLLEQVTMGDLRGESLFLADLVGLDGFKNLVRTFGGSSKLYIPALDSIVMPLRDELIRREYDGGNIFELSRKWGLTDRWIQELVKDKAKELRRRPMDGQITLFD